MSSVSGPTQANVPKAVTTISESQLRREAVKETLFSFFITVIFGGFIVVPILLGRSNNALLITVGACGGLFLLLYNGKLKKAKNFLVAIEGVRRLVSNNYPLRAQEELGHLAAPLRILQGPLAELKAEVGQAIEKHKEQQRLVTQEAEKKKREELLNQIQSKDVLDSISPQEFELIVLEAFARLGYEATHTPWSADGGIDGILLKGEKKTAVQCKKHSNPVGQPYLRDFLGAMVHAKCDEGVFVTTSHFSAGARTFAKANKIKLIDGNEVVDLLRQTINEDFVLNGRLVKFPRNMEEKTCPRCGGRLRKRLGRNGFFWGCSNYPRCRHTENSVNIRFRAFRGS